jgi:hypothetical protein
VSAQKEGTLALAASTKELGEIVTNIFRKRGMTGRPSLRPVMDRQDFQNVIRALADQGATYMSWNATGTTKTIRAIRLADFLGEA